MSPLSPGTEARAEGRDSHCRPGPWTRSAAPCSARSDAQSNPGCCRVSIFVPAVFHGGNRLRKEMAGSHSGPGRGLQGPPAHRLRSEPLTSRSDSPLDTSGPDFSPESGKRERATTCALCTGPLLHPSIACLQGTARDSKARVRTQVHRPPSSLLTSPSRSAEPQTSSHEGEGLECDTLGLNLSPPSEPPFLPTTREEWHPPGPCG